MLAEGLSVAKGIAGKRLPPSRNSAEDWKRFLWPLDPSSGAAHKGSKYQDPFGVEAEYHHDTVSLLEPFLARPEQRRPRL